MDKNEELLFNQMLEEYMPEEKKKNDVVVGIIIRKEREFSYLDINDKSEGRILTQEIEDLNEGDTVEAKVISVSNDNIVVSKFLLEKDRELDKYNENDIVEGKIIRKQKGGYTILIGKNEAFLPFSLSGFAKDTDPVGKVSKFLVKEKKRNKLLLSRTDILKEEEKAFLEGINIGDTLEGAVSQILDFGLVVDFGNSNGLVHVSEISWDRNNNFKNEYKVGQTVKVKVIEKNVENRKIKLSIKQLEKDPWLEVVATHKIGDTVKVTVKDILDFGFIVELDKNHGFIHISEVSWDNIRESFKSYKVGDEVDAKIIEIDNNKKNIKLSIKQLSENPWNAVKERYKIGDVLEKEIKEILDFGLVFDFEGNDDAFVHVSEISNRRNIDLRKSYQVGDIHKLKVIGYNDEKRRLILSLKAMLGNLWEDIDSLYKVNQQATAKIVNLQDYGIFLELPEKLEIFIHRNDFSWNKEENITFNLDEEVSLVITKVDKENRKLSGSIKNLTESPLEEETKELEELMKKYGV